MRKLKKLVLTDFQCWAHQEFNFDKGLNIIIGDSDHGKSTVLRAILSCFNGRIDLDWIRIGAKCLIVEMWFEDGCKAIRVRSKKSNTVSFIDVNGKVNEWERIGTGLPEEYLRMLGETEIKLPDGSTINPCISTQLDPHFFLTLSDNIKAKVMGSISGLDMIDGALGITINEQREIQGKIKSNLSRVEECKSQKAILEHEIISNEKFYKKFKVISDKNYENIEKLNKIFTLKSNINEKSENIEIVNFQINKQNKILVGLKANVDQLGKVKLLQDVSKLAQGIRNSKQVIVSHECDDEIVSSKIYALFQAKKILESVGKRSSDLKIIFNLYEKIKNSSLNLNFVKEINKQTENNLENYNNQYKEIFKDIKKCPLCGSILGENK